VGSDDYSVWGQEANGATWALCMMNMFLHNTQARQIAWADTLRHPMLLEENRLARFNVVVANPPFSLDKWGPMRQPDPYRRFHRGVPPGQARLRLHHAHDRDDVSRPEQTGAWVWWCRMACCSVAARKGRSARR
jgi:type I restriction-modification system DNA methylase subunit